MTNGRRLLSQAKSYYLQLVGYIPNEFLLSPDDISADRNGCMDPRHTVNSAFRKLHPNRPCGRQHIPQCFVKREVVSSIVAQPPTIVCNNFSINSGFLSSNKYLISEHKLKNHLGNFSTAPTMQCFLLLISMHISSDLLYLFLVVACGRVY
uniref:Uncharacterized protein n=1 Tax=Glossina palpalis gambiensis TaxID=67801 RepID=A0A1B0BJS3_9MUSC